MSRFVWCRRRVPQQGDRIRCLVEKPGSEGAEWIVLQVLINPLEPKKRAFVERTLDDREIRAEGGKYHSRRWYVGSCCETKVEVEDV